MCFIDAVQWYCYFVKCKKHIDGNAGPSRINSFQWNQVLIFFLLFNVHNVIPGIYVATYVGEHTWDK